MFNIVIFLTSYIPCPVPQPRALLAFLLPVALRRGSKETHCLYMRMLHVDQSETITLYYDLTKTCYLALVKSEYLSIMPCFHKKDEFHLLTQECYHVLCLPSC